jgi:protoheme ferro-lyase
VRLPVLPGVQGMWRHELYISHHGLGLGMVQDGDPYRDEMEQCVGMIMDELTKRGWNNHYSLAYQSRVGPVGLPALTCTFPVW